MFDICRNQFHLPQNGGKGLKLVSKMALKKWNMNFCLEYSTWKNRTTFSHVLWLPEIFHWNNPKKLCSIYFPTGLSRNVLYVIYSTTIATLIKTYIHLDLVIVCFMSGTGPEFGVSLGPPSCYLCVLKGCVHLSVLSCHIS